MSNEILMNVINSNDLTTLAAICSKIISSVPSPNSNPFAFEKVIVMNKGMQTYLQQEIAEQNGVCSGIDFVQVWAFIWSLHKSLNNADSSNRFSHEHMTWSIFSLMEDIAESDDPIYEPMKEYLKIESSIEKTEKAYQLCGAIADTFDQYQMYRPDWILDWNQLSDEDFNAVSVKDGKYRVAEGSKLEKWIKKVAKDYRLKGVNQNSINSILGNIWQIRLWTKLKGNLEKTNDNEANLWDRATVVKSLIEKLTDLKNNPNKIDYNSLPKRVFIFGVTALPTQVIELFRALGQVVPVFFMNLNPCKEYWGDLRSEFSEWKSEKKAIIKYLRANALSEKFNLSPLAGTSGFEFKGSEDDYYNNFEKLFDENKEIVDGNPLLISLGKQGRDTLNVLLSQDAQVDITPAFINPAEDVKSDAELSILDSLKYRLLTLSKNSEQKHKISANDRSVQIRSCHTPMREIEILRDEILSTIKREKELNGNSTAPRDMLVMMPDIESYAPLIEAVFGSVNRDDPDFIPYSICDKTVRSSSKIADAVVQLLSIGNKGITANLVIDLLSVDAIAKKFDITVDDLSVIESWLDKVNVHWGLDEEDIKEHLKLDDNVEPLPWTLDAGLERLLNGFMLGKDGSAIAYDNFESGDFELLNKFCDFVDKIKLVRDVFSPNLNITTLEWTDKLQSLLLNNFFVLDDDSKEEVEAISQILSEMNEAVNNLKGSESSQDNSENKSPFDEGVRSNIKIKLPVFRAKLIHAFGNDRDSSRYLRGGLIFCSLMPMRAVPFKHIYILGLNDDAFPRKDTTPSFNLMGVKSLSRINDRSLSIDDRYIFLEAILSAEKSLYLSYLGESPIDKTQKNPSTVITELEDYLGDNFTVQDTDDVDQNRQEVIARIFRQEYLNSYDLRNYEKEDSSLKLYPSFNEKAFWVQDKGQKSKYVPIGFLQDHNEDNPWNISLPYNITVSISDLMWALLKPCQNILKNGLRIRLDLKYQTDLKDEEPFDLGSYGGNDILSELFAEDITMPNEVDAYLDQKAKKGELPYGIFLDKVKTQVKERLNTLLAIKAELANDNNSEESYLKTVEVEVAGQKHQVTFGGMLPKHSNVVLGYLSSDNKTPPNLIIESYLRLLAYKFTTRQQLQPIKVIKVNSKGQSSYEIDPYNFIDLCEKNSAEALLKELVTIYLETNLTPVPIVRASYKNIVIAKDPSLYLKLAVGQDKYEDKFIQDKEATYLFGQDTSMQFDGDYLSKRQKELANKMLALYAEKIALVAAEPKKPNKK